MAGSAISAAAAPPLLPTPANNSPALLPTPPSFRRLIPSPASPAPSIDRFVPSAMSLAPSIRCLSRSPATPSPPGRASASESWVRDKAALAGLAPPSSLEGSKGFKIPGRASLSESWVEDKLAATAPPSDAPANSSRGKRSLSLTPTSNTEHIKNLAAGEALLECGIHMWFWYCHFTFSSDKQIPTRIQNLLQRMTCCQAYNGFESRVKLFSGREQQASSYQPAVLINQLKVKREINWTPTLLSHQTKHYPSSRELLPGVPPASGDPPRPTAAVSPMAGAAPTVTKSPPSLVPPAGPTPGGSLPLSSIDKTAAVRVSVDFIQVFPAPGGGDQAASVATMREGFARALVPYYPVAGRIAEPVPGEPEIECTGEGVWFVEAEASCSLEEARNLERPLCIPKEELLPRPPAGVPVEDTVLLAQVTKFTCGGFAVGICFSHLVFDGQGAAQFLKAVGEMARGIPEPSIKPIWARDAIPNPPKPPLGPPPSFTAFNFEKSVVEISLDSIKRVKDQVANETNQKCSTFDVVTAIIFKCRALAVDFAPDAEVRLGFAASTRHLLSNALPSVEGYYGNCVYPGGLTKTSQEVKEASLVEIVTAIREAKEALSSRFLDWLSGGAKENHYNVSLDYGTLVVTDWSHVGFNEVDYGFGEPSYVFTLNDDVNIVPSVVYLKPPKPKQGIRLVLQCVEGQHSAVFSEELQKHA